MSVFDYSESTVLGHKSQSYTGSQVWEGHSKLVKGFWKLYLRGLVQSQVHKESQVLLTALTCVFSGSRTAALLLNGARSHTVQPRTGLTFELVRLWLQRFCCIYAVLCTERNTVV